MIKFPIFIVYDPLNDKNEKRIFKGPYWSFEDIVIKGCYWSLRLQRGKKKMDENEHKGLKYM